MHGVNSNYAWPDPQPVCDDPSKQNGRMSGLMSAIGTKRTFNHRPTMSAFGGKADIGRRRFNVRF
jgi:hypothetical protein